MVAEVKNTDAYPWLCGTLNGLTKPISDGNNIVCSNETDTADSIVTDAYDTFGLKCVYYRVTEDLLRDKLYGEDQLRMILRSWYFNGYVEQLPPNVRSYQLQGIWGEDTVTMFASIGAFNYYSTYGGADKNTPEVYEEQPPSIGDIIYIPANDYFYRIVDVKYYEQAFGLKPHTYTFTLKVYKDNKYTVSADSPTLSDPNDPIYRVAPDSLPGQYEIRDILATNDMVNNSAKANPDPYNNINVMYDPDAPARNQVDRLHREIAQTAKELAEEFAAINTDIDAAASETNGYINKTENYREENERQISEISQKIDKTGEILLNVSANGVELEDIGHNKETVYYTKVNNTEEDSWP